MKANFTRFSLIFYNFIIIGTLIFLRGTFVPKSDDPGLITWALHQQVSLPPDWSPMYLDWVRLIHCFIYSETQIYCILYIIAVIFLSLMTYSVLYIISKSPTMTFFLSLLLFFSPVSPIIAHFSDLPSSIIMYYGISFFMLGMSCLIYYEKRIGQLFAIVCFVIASLLRPEFFIAVILILSYFIGIAFVYIRIFSYRWYILFLTLLGVTMFLYHHYGLPIPFQSRSILAFGQHFAVRYCENYKNMCMTLNINQWVSWRKILPLAFSVYDQKITFFNLFMNNPTAIINHISMNFIQTFAGIFSLGFFIPLFIFNSIFWIIMGLITGTIVFIFFIKFNMHYKKQLFLFKQPLIALLIIISCIPSIFASIVFFPRIHYIALIVYTLIILICPFSTQNTNQK